MFDSAQEDAILMMFTETFCILEERKREFYFNQFVIRFSKAIGDWKSKCRHRLRMVTDDESILNHFDRLSVVRDTLTDLDTCQVRLLRKEDYEQVCDILSYAFLINLFPFNLDRFEKYVQSGYSVVAYRGEEILGVILAYETPDIESFTVFMEIFVVRDDVRDCGIGSKMFHFLRGLVCEKSDSVNCVIKLVADRSTTAYDIYKEWGFLESRCTNMCFRFEASQYLEAEHD